MKKNISTKDIHKLPDEATLKILSRLAIVAAIITVPFVIYNFIIHNYLLGITSSIIIGVFTFTAWSVTVNKIYYSKTTFWLLAPTFIFFLAFTILQVGSTGVLWTYPIILSFYSMLPEKKAYIANGVLLLIIIPIIWINTDNYFAFRATATLLLVYIFSGIFINVINKQQRQLKELVVTDPLTQLLNRSLLQETLEQAIENNHRTKTPMSIATFDLDDFKNINDLHGHALGDKILQEVSKLFLKRCRKIDRIFRLGGEEFLIFLYNTSNSDAINLTEELRIKIENMDTIPDIRITASAGIATLREDETCQEWVNRSDDNQYKAKSLGKNRIVA